MKRILLTVAAVLLAVTVVSAKEAKTMLLKGYIVDNHCAAKQTKDQMDSFIKAHSKGCTVSEPCAKSGFAIYANHKLYKFDKKSNEMISEFLAKPDTQLLVAAEVKKEGNEVRLISIKNE